MIPAHDAGEPARVVLDFEPRLSTYLEYQPIHRSQTKPEVLGDGWVRITLTIHVLYDLVRWIRGHGCSVRVVEPEYLRDWVESRRGGEYYREYVLDRVPRVK